MAYGTDPAVSGSGSGSGYGKDPVQRGTDQPSGVTGDIRTGAENFLQGVNTGLAGDVVGAGQLAGYVLPKAITDPIANSTIGRKLSETANRPTPGIAGGAGNLVGAGLPFLIQPELGIGAAARGVPYIGRALKTLWDIVRTSTIPSAVQPANSPGERARNIAIGTGVGVPLHFGGQAAGRQLEKWANQRAAGRAYDASREAAQQARQAAEDRAAKVGRVNQSIDSRNKALTGNYRQAQAGRAQQTYQDRVVAQAAQRARDAIPATETLNWWREALTPIGEQGRAPTAVTPQATAQVRRIIGDRLTNVRSQMLINPADAGFRDEIDGIRREVDGQLSNQGMRDQWAFEPEQRFDAQHNPIEPSRGDTTRQQNSVWSKFVEQPLANIQYLSGQQLSDYSSRLGDLAEQYARRAATAPQAERPELEAISRGLRRVVDVADRHGTSDPALLKQLTDAKRSYMLWSIGNGSTAAEKGGEMTPGRIAREWARRQGDASYGAEMDPGHPRFHPENARMKHRLELARQAHEETPQPVAPQPPLRPPSQRPQIPLPKIPKVPPERTVDQRLPAAGGHVVQHATTALTGSPTAGRIARGIYHYGGRGAARPVLGATKGVGAVTPGVVGGAAKIPEIVVTAPRYRPNEEKQ